MGLILCEHYDVKHPYYVRILGKRIYSLEELCYVIYEFPLIVMDDFVCDALFDFLLNDLNLGMAAVNMKKKKHDGYFDEDILIDILSYSDYYSSAEVEKYKVKTAAYRKLPKAEYLKQKADFMFSIKKYSAAAQYYELAIDESATTVCDNSFIAKAMNNTGCCYANIFKYDEAFNSFRKSYELIKDDKVIKNIYFLSLVDPVIENKQMYAAYIGDKSSSNWDNEYNSAVIAARTSEEIENLNQVFEKDSVKRNKEINRIFNTWKQDYRNMT